MGKLRGLMDKMTHKDHEQDTHAHTTAQDEDDNQWLHQSSRDLGHTTSSDKPDGGHGIKGVY